MNIGHFDRLSYDSYIGDAYTDKVIESTKPLKYMLNTDQIHNCNRCLTTYGSLLSTTVRTTTTPMPMCDIESVGKINFSNYKLFLLKSSRLAKYVVQ